VKLNNCHEVVSAKLFVFEFPSAAVIEEKSVSALPQKEKYVKTPLHVNGMLRWICTPP